MDTKEVIRQARALRKHIGKYATESSVLLMDPFRSRPGRPARAIVSEFLRQYAGPRNFFSKEAAEVEIDNARETVRALQQILAAFIEYHESELGRGVSPERQARVEVVSDFLGQAQALLANEKFHPAAAAVLIGAALEEFLRTWFESVGLSIGNAKPGIDAYAKALREAELLGKQDMKDITSWAGTRNDAAHGVWEKVEDRERIRNVLEGVNLFLRQKSG